jgi:hypothetical protein
VLVREGLWVVEGVVDYGGGREVDFVLILELRDGKVFRETRYYADRFEAPESRAEWFERMQRWAIDACDFRRTPLPQRSVNSVG